MVESNFGIIIQARLNSKRFPKKVLKRLDKKNSVLQFQISRISKEFDKKNIFIANTLKKEDIKICRISQKNGIRFFKGSERNVIKRYIDCAKKFKIDIPQEKISKQLGNGKLLSSNNVVLFEGKWENDEQCGAVVKHIALLVWLESLSLTEYYEDFAKDGYDDLEIISSMEEDDLKEAG